MALSKSKFFTSILIVVVGSTSFLTAEVLARWIIWDERAYRVCDRDTHHALRPNVRSKHRWGRNVVPYFTNSLGLRDREASRVDVKRLKERRILFLGDSFAEGLGVPFERTFVGILGIRYADTDVFTGGVMSYAPLLEYRQLLRIGDALRPNMVVVLVDVGDVQDEIIYRSEAITDVEGGIRGFRCVWWWETLRRSQVVRSLNDLRHKWSDWSGASRAVALWTEKDRAQYRTEWLSSRDAYKAWGQRGLELLLESLYQIRHYCRTRDCKVAIVIFPDSTVLRYRGTQLREFRERMGDFAQRHQIPLLDLFKVFDDVQDASSLFILGDWHWNEAGHRLVADLLYDFLAKIQ